MCERGTKSLKPGPVEGALDAQDLAFFHIITGDGEDFGEVLLNAEGLGGGPIAFMLFVGLGGILFAVGILLYLYSLVGAKVEPSKQ